MEKRLLMLLTGLFLSLGMAVAQIQVKGNVVSSDTGDPVIGATIRVVGDNNTGTTTDFNGDFTLTVPTNGQISVSFIGYISQTLAAKPKMNIILEPEDNKLNDVVVVAYGTAKRQSITGSVSVVDEKQLQKRIATSVTAALEGSAPGIQVNNTYGEPGSAPSIRIRGIGSLVSGAQSPLYVVDGVAYDGNISELNSNDIESISVLKDASSAALYGNRAANGVILITTKRGKGTAKPVVTVKITQGAFSRGIAEYDRLGADDWMESAWTAMKHFAMNGTLGYDEATAAAYATEHVVSDFARRNIYDGEDNALFDSNGKLIANRLSGYDDLDWEDAVERNGYRQEYNISGAAAGEKFNFYSSVGYLKEQGYINAIGFERLTARLNSTYTPNKWLKTGVNLMGTYAKSNYNENATGNMYANPFYVARYMAPVYPYYMHNADGSYQLDENGNKIYDTTSPYLDNRNIVYELEANFNRSRRALLEGQAFATVTLPYGFSVTVKGDASHSNTNRKQFDNPEIGDGASSNGRLTFYDYQYNTYTFQQMLNWEHEYGVNHIDVLAGHENYQWKRKMDYGMNTTMAVDNNYTLTNFLTNSFLYGSDDIYKTESYLARVRYNYDEKYFADFSWRRDGSSRFKDGNRWGDFFSVGANWNIKKENFMKDVKWVDQLRLRASYGEVGNDAGVSLYGWMALYEIYSNGGNPALIRQSLPADDIKWETTQTIDIGIEGQLFGRLNFDLGFFDKRSKDLLFQVRLPYSGGTYPSDWTNYDSNMSVYRNIGTISNKGFEFAINGDVIRTKDWTWNLGTEGTFLHNEIIKLPDHEDILHGLQNYSEGHDAYEFYTYHFEGVDQMTGRSLYTLDPDMRDAAEANGALVTINGKDYTMETAYGKRDWAGTALPTFYGSFSSNLRWKDLSLSMLFTYSLGGKVYDGTYQSLMSTPSSSSAAAMHKDVQKSWNGVPAGMTETSANRIDPDGIPILDFATSDYNNATSDRWLTSASYFVMKNLTLAYSLPRTWLHPLGIESAVLNFTCENLFTVTSRKGLNPQYNFSGGYDDTYVTARVFNFGVTVSF